MGQHLGYVEGSCPPKRPPRPRSLSGVYSPAVLLKAFVQEVGKGLASVTSLHLRVKNSGTSSVTLAMLWEAVAVLLGACTKLTCFSYTGHTLPLAFLHTLGAVCPLMTTFNTWARTNDGQNLQDVIGLLPSVLPQLHSLGLGSGPLPNMSGNTSVRSLELYCFDFKASSEWLCLPPQLRTLKCDNVCVGPPAKSLEGNASLQSLLTLIVFNRAMSLKTLTEMLQAAPALQEIQIDGHCPEGEGLAIDCPLGPSTAMQFTLLQQRMHIHSLQNATYTFDSHEEDSTDMTRSFIQALPCMAGVMSCKLRSCLPAVANDLLKVFPDIKQLCLSSPADFDDVSMQAVGSCSKLTRLSFSDCPSISSVGLLVLCARMPHLTSVEYSECDRLKPADLERLAGMLKACGSNVEFIP